MRYVKSGALLLAGFLLLVGYVADRAPTEVAVSRTVNLPAAEPGSPRLELAGVWELPLGPWVTYKPPRKFRPRVYAHAGCVVDGRSGAVLWGRKAEQARPIASIVKLLTAIVYLESGGDLNSKIKILPEDARNAGKSVLWKGHEFFARDVFTTALLSSDNRAARALARSTPYTPEQFVARMNERAWEIGCRTMDVTEPTGLSEKNVASPLDVARLMAMALTYPEIAKVCRTYRHEFKQQNGRKRYRIVNSNRMLLSKYKSLGGKTGYIVEAGWCLVNMIETSDGPLTVVVLGASSNSSRFTQARRLTAWALKYRERSKLFSLAP